VLPVVEGPNDVIALDHLGIPAVGLCGNRVTAEQARKVASYAQALGVPIGLMLDNDTEGESGTRQSLPVLAEHWSVRLIWSSSMYDAQFKGRQPESLSEEEWQLISKQ
jgi:DNA primase